MKKILITGGSGLIGTILNNHLNANYDVQNLDLKIGNVNEKSLDEVFNGVETQKTQKEYVHNCNQCWINFHRKYDVVLYRNLEKFFPKGMVGKLFGYYQWSDDRKETYSKLMEKAEKESLKQK